MSHSTQELLQRQSQKKMEIYYHTCSLILDGFFDVFPTALNTILIFKDTQFFSTT